MLGIVFGIGTSSILSIIIWRTGATPYFKHECALIQKCLTSGCLVDDPSFAISRPGQLVNDLRQVRDHPMHAMSAINEIVSDIDFETRWTSSGAQAYSRISVTAGIAGACIELAIWTQNSLLQATVSALVAVSAGLLGAGSCAVMGQWAFRRTLRRRHLWDEFVQWILKSEFPQTAWTVHDIRPRSTYSIQNGQRPRKLKP